MLQLAASSGIGCAEGDYTLTAALQRVRGLRHRHDGRPRPGAAVDGRSIGDGSTGPVTKQLTELYADLTATTGTTVA